MKDQIESELVVLIGLALCYASRAVDVGTFGFGKENDDVFRGKPRKVPDFRLHIQEMWRIVRDDVILVGYGDYF